LRILLFIQCAAASGYQAMKSVQERVQRALFEVGLTPERLIYKHLLPALAATETEFAKSEGQITDAREVIASGTRFRAIEIVCEMASYYQKREGVESSGEELNRMPKAIDATIVRRDSAQPEGK
jgi:hypothetical protein